MARRTRAAILRSDIARSAKLSPVANIRYICRFYPVQSVSYQSLFALALSIQLLWLSQSNCSSSRDPIALALLIQSIFLSRSNRSSSPQPIAVYNNAVMAHVLSLPVSCESSLNPVSCESYRSSSCRSLPSLAQSPSPAQSPVASQLPVARQMPVASQLPIGSYSELPAPASHTYVAIPPFQLPGVHVMAHDQFEWWQ